MTPIEQQNGWSAYEKLVMYRLDEQDKKLDRIDRKVDGVARSVLILKVKAATYGAIAGAVLAAFIAWLK